MREKELRLALVCYGGISLAVYMHGVTKEIWHLARASRALHDGAAAAGEGSEGVYRRLLSAMEDVSGMRLRVLCDIVAGASAGGINGIFLAQAMASGQSLEPLTDLWLEMADVDRLLDPDARPLGRFTKVWATPIAWLALRRSGNPVDATVESAGADEVRTKLSRFIRARWFQPPFGGAIMTNMLFDAFDAMAADRRGRGAPLLPRGHPVDLMVTITDLAGHPQKLRLNSPAIVTESEHRLLFRFRHVAGAQSDGFRDPVALVAAARATSSFPGAFPPFTLREIDRVLEKRERAWPERADFIRVQYPATGDDLAPDDRALIDGSVLANAPFRPAIQALRQRPARREVDRRFIFVDPKPDVRSISLANTTPRMDADGDGSPEPPGFLATIIGALSEIPREQPIRDNVEAIEGMSARIRRMRRIVDAMRREVEEQVERLFGRTFFLTSPTPARLGAWRAKAQQQASAHAGFAFVAYGHLKLSHIVEDLAATYVRLHRLEGADALSARDALWSAARARGLDRIADGRRPASGAIVDFFRAHDIGFRIRRLRFLARHLDAAVEARRMTQSTEADTDVAAMHAAIFDGLGYYLERQNDDFFEGEEGAVSAVPRDPSAFLDWIAQACDMLAIDAVVDALLADALGQLPRDDRRSMLLAYLGFPFYDVATLPLLQGEGGDEYDPIKIDRISPSDANAIREGGAEATLKGVQFNSFGAFFSRAYRENDYLWGRLHGADRLIDIVASTHSGDAAVDREALLAIKRAAFHAILDEESERLGQIADLIATLRTEIDATA